MTIIGLLIEIYLAAMLGVSGLAKMDAPAHFEATLLRHRLLPGWSVRPVSRAVPWLEVALALALVAGIAPVITGAMTALLLACFLAVETALVITHRATECSCFGVAYRVPVDGASLVVSLILLSLAGLHLWIVLAAPPPSLPSRLAAGLISAGAGAWLVGKMLARHRAASARRLADA